MKKLLVILMVIMLVFTLVACGSNDPADNGDNGNPNQEDPVDPPDGNDNGDNGNDDGTVDNGNEDPVEDPAEPQIEDTIELEGMEEPITLMLYEDKDASFRTYVPSDFLAEKVSDLEHRFYANYVNKVEDVYMQLYFFPENTTEDELLNDADNQVSVLLKGMDPVEEDFRYYDWAIHELKSTDQPRTALVGKHGDTYFVMTLYYHGEYSEGFVPRANKIMEHFYWTDTSEYLMK
ncbi:hypothetical protein J0B03_09595 [Alkalibacter rhizosphaerae]|uniref:Lipoprotein n=1 Tax=Alkalibacter rhizosphaerae TaxID=2815577 RepID=A0A975AHW4_9FIRM|nr:hypothetical protein [Alkalibacter rhizosphaerae]QSX08049.1 hypothetical protein J0B03_09595 [Alkalibacter rhizosphaerae]